MRFLIYLFCLLWPVFADIGFDEGRNPTVAKVIRANLLSDRRSVFLSWEPPKEKGELIIARSNSIIDSPDKLYVADSLGKFPSGGPDGVKTYYDYNLRPGTYFFAIVLATDIRKREVKLIASQNYTTVPVIIEDSEGSLFNLGSPQNAELPKEENTDKFHVADLTAKLEKKAVRLEWTPPKGAQPKRTMYTVYRSTQPLTSLPLIQKAVKLAEVSHPTLTFLDQGLEKSQTLYYGVSVKEVNGEEHLPLIDKESTLRVFYVKDDRTQSAELIQDQEPGEKRPKKSPPKTDMQDAPGTLHTKGIGYERVGKGVLIAWKSPPNADATTVYTIYASLQPMDKGIVSFNSESTVKVATVIHPKTNFYLKELKKMDNLYFGVTVKSDGIPEDYNLIERLSFFRFSFDQDNPLPEATEVVKENSKDIPKEEKVSANLEPKTNSLIFLPEIENSFDDSDTQFQITRTEKEKEKEEIEPKETKDNLDAILRETYFSKKWELTIDRLGNYTKQTTDPQQLGKAFFYMGLAHNKKREFKEALRYFLRKETKDFEPERTKFWTNQTLEAMGKKRI